jgi:hypothetical protein
MVIAEGIAVVAALAGLVERPPLDPAVHLALGGTLTGFTGWLERVKPLWSSVEAGARQRWERDRAILGVAGKARVARFERAASALGLATSEPQRST